MTKLSVALAVFNEENNLQKCLESVEDFANEIVIVDGGSSDKTLEIAKKFNTKITQTTNPKIFHINKNKAIDATSGDWILQLDADEIVTEELKEEIKKNIESNEFDGYWIPRKNFFLGKFLTKGGQYPDYTLRLYRKGKGRLPAEDVHEQAEVNGDVGYLKSPLLHMRDKDFSEYIERFNRYTTLYSDQLGDKDLKITLFSFLDFVLLKPILWFLKSYLRHKGFIDGFPGFVFSLFSSLRFPVAYLKYWLKFLKRSKNESSN